MERNVEKRARALMARVVAVCGFVAMAVGAGAQEPVRQQEGKPAVEISEPRIVERGPHHRVIERTITERLPNGKTVERKSSYTELATGLHYQNEKGEWLESREEIEIIDGNAVARLGPVQAVWNATLNREGAVDVLTPDGKRFRSHILGLAYTDAVSGKSVLIAEPKECVGEVVGNQVYYRDAFDGPFRADVRYTYTKSGVSQDILIRETLPPAKEYGFGEERIRIEVWTEFTVAPEPVKGFGQLKTETEISARALMVDPDLTDETLDFGAMRIGNGAAFPMESESGDSFEKSSAPVGKNWLQLEGRTFLIEKIDLRDIEQEVSRLPKSAVLNNPSKVQMQASAKRALPRRELLASLGTPVRKEAKNERGMIRLAAMLPPEKGYVLDYSMVASATNFTFTGGKTFFIVGAVNLSGQTVLEPAVLKYTNGSAATLKILGTLDCRTDTYRPAFFAAKDDNTVGEVIAGSTGNPTNGTSGYGRQIDLTGTTNVVDVHDVHMRHANYCFNLASTSKLLLRHAQLSSNYTGVVIQSGEAVLRNVLIHDATYAFGGLGTNARCEQVTFHRLNFMRSGTGSSYTTSLTNSLLLAVASNLVYAGVNIVSNASDSGYFQTVGGGARYLVNSSTNRNSGTTNINAALLADLKLRTTEPPKTLFSYITANTNFAPVIAGDTTGGDLPDLGYHYPIIDYLASAALIDTGVTVVATNGVNIAIDYSHDDWGFPLLDGKFISQGSANATNRIFRARMVQEKDTRSANSSWAMFYDVDGGAGQSSEARFRFTELIQLPTDGFVIYSGKGLAAFEATHSSLYGVSLVLDTAGTGLLAAGLTNNLIDSGGAQFGVGGATTNVTVHLRNNLFRNASLDFISGTTNWTVRDNVFLGMTNNINDHGSPVQNSYNAYCNSTNQYFTGGTSNVLVTNIAYETGPRGRYYLPSGSPLVNTGSVSAASAGLYHFTTTTNQVKETNSTVDLGLHYVALNGSGQLVDSDGDGFADYLEDANGNGVADGSENSAVNPVLTMVGSMTYIKGGPAKRFDTNAIAYDADSTNLAGAKLTLTLTSGGESGDRLAVRNQGTNAGQISVSGTNISYGGVLIATNSGGSGTTPLVISFNASAANAALQALVRNLTFQNVSNSPANSNRVVKFELHDGKGGSNAPTTVAINIACPAAVDVMLLFDRSGSMEKVYTNGVYASNDVNRFWTAKAAASNFVSMLDFAADRVGLITFDGSAYFVHGLTTNGSAVQSSIYSQTVGTGTILDPPINMARTNYATSGSNTLRLMVILSDGEEWPATNTSVTLAAADAAKDEGTRIISIGFHTGECTGCGGTNHMRLIASSDLDYYFAPSFSEMQSNFTAVAQSICRSGPTNAFPMVSITSPTNGASFNAPLNTTITIAASDDGSVTNVALYLGTTNVASFTMAPYGYEWTNVFGGSYVLKAVATDNTGLRTTSSVVNVTVVKQLPQVSIVAPTNATRFASVMNLLVRAAATDADGRITNVVFYTNNVPVVTSAVPPFRFPWTNLTSGSYQVYAKAWDNDGLFTNSPTVTFNVDACPQVGVTNLTLSTNTVMGGSNVIATITLSTNAPAGGQMVALTCTDPNVSIPASVLVPAGTSNVTFKVETFVLAATASATLTAETPASSRTASLSVVGSGFTSTRYRGECGPMDVAIAFDFNLMNDNAFLAVTNGVYRLLDNIESASGGDYRLAMVVFAKGAYSHITTNYVKNDFSTTNKLAVIQTLSSLIPPNSGDVRESHYDETINTIVNALPAAGRPQVGDFTGQFRNHARKMLVLISHTLPIKPGIDILLDESEIAFESTHQRAMEAELKGIQICTITTPFTHTSPTNFTYWPNDPVYPLAVRIAEDSALATGGMFFQTWPYNDPAGFNLALDMVVSRCGADLGEVVVTRDDLRPKSHTALTLNNSTTAGVFLEAATFDLTGVNGRVSAAHLSRAGNLRVNFGSQFDLGLGVASFLDTNLQAFAPPTRSAQLTPMGSAYTTNWHLPFSFFADIESYMGRPYPLALVERVSSVCGNNFEVIDTPQLDWSTSKNILTLKALAPFQIAQGRCRDLVLAGTNAPADCEWDILLYDQVIARSCQPSAWSVEADQTVYGGFNICVPADAVTARRYEVRVRDGGGADHSGYFEVLPAGGQNAAPMLQPLMLSNRNAQNNEVLSLTVSLDAPAEGDGAYVSLTNSNLPSGLIPSYVHIPAGESAVDVAFNAPTTTNNMDYAITASFNGRRTIRGAVLVTVSGGTVQNVTATGRLKRIDVRWDAFPGAVYYRVTRVISVAEEIVAEPYFGTCIADTNVTPGVETCYFVTAVTPFGDSLQSDITNPCPTASDGILRPRIEPHGGRFNDRAIVSITCETTNAYIYWSTNGIVPDLNNDVYTGPITIDHSAQLIARAYDGSVWSEDDRADFRVVQPTVLGCGNPITSTLSSTNNPSVFKGTGYYGARYSFTGRRGDTVTISATSTDFAPDLNLTDPATNLVLQSGYPLTLLQQFSPVLKHTLRSDGRYVLEVTSVHQFATGTFTVSVDCAHGPELDVFHGSTNLASGAAFDLGLKTNGATAAITLLITNSGSDTLTFSSVAITPAQLFSISPATITSLATNSATNLTVTFNALSNGPWTGTLVLANNDGFDDDAVTGVEIDENFTVQFSAFVNPLGGTPLVYPTGLTNGQILTTPPALALTASAISTNGASITQVQFRVTGPTTLAADSALVSGVATNGSWRYYWSNAPGGSYSLKVFAKDNGGHAAFSTNVAFTVNNPPVAVKDRFSVYTGSTDNFLDVVANDTDADHHTLTLTNVLFSPPTHGTNLVSAGGVLYTPTNNYTGYDSFSYLVYDSLGARATGLVSIAVFPEFGQLADPVALLTAPSNNVEIAGVTNIMGTASHQFLQFWELQYRRRGSAPTPWTTFAEGTDCVTNGFLGTFDPTGLPNGIYQIKLKTVAWTDVAVETSLTLRVGESPKIGHFTLAFTDLQIPVSGLPITLTRSYDSRNTDSGDFGAGWNLDVSSVRLEKSGIMGEGWQAVTGSGAFGAGFAGLQESEDHLVSIVFPDDKVFRFRASVTLNGSGKNETVATGMDAAEANISYVPLPGTTGTLRELNATPYLGIDFTAFNVPLTLHDSRGTPTEDDDAGPVYDPQAFEFTTLDGRRFQFNATGKIVKMWDRVGNSLTFNSGGIVHSSGKSVKFLRDAAGRITEIYDPNGLSTNGLPNGPAALSYQFDGAGNLVTVHRLTTRSTTDPKYVTTQFGYEHTKYPHYITKIIDPRGVTGIRNEYGDDGKLTLMTDANGKKIQYIHSVSNKTEIIVDRMGFTNIFKYDATGNVLQTVDALNHTNSFGYDANGNQTAVTNALGFVTRFDYDANQNRTAVIDPLGFTNRTVFNTEGEPVQQIDPLGNPTYFGYDSVGNLTSVTNALGHRHSVTYTAEGNLASTKDPLGRTTGGFSYDTFGNLRFATNLLAGTTVSFGHDANGNRTNSSRQWINPTNGADIRTIETKRVFDAEGKETVTTDPEGNQSSVVYNEIGAPDQVIDRYNHATTRMYDARGNVIQITHSDGTLARSIYDEAGRLFISEDSHLPGASVTGTRHTYDAVGQVIRSEKLTNLVINFLTSGAVPETVLVSAGTAISTNGSLFDAAGRLLATTNALGRVTRYEYDKAGRQTAVIDALNNRTDNAYDAAGRLTATTNALGKVTQYEYDKLGRRVRTVFPDTTFTGTAYNELGQRLRETNQLGLVTDFEYNTNGRLSAIVKPAVLNPEGGTNARPRYEFEYDSASQLSLVRDPKGRATRFSTDFLGRPVSHTLPLGQTASQVFSSAGRLFRKVDFKGQTNEFVYDSFGRIGTNRFFVPGSGVATGIVAYAYDDEDRLKQIIEPRGTNTLDYDTKGNIARVTSPEGIANHEYDMVEGQRLRLYTTNTDLRYSYDELGRLKTVSVIKRDGVTLSTPEVTTNTYTALGSLKDVYFPNGVRAFYEYDLMNRLTNLAYTTSASVLLAQYRYTPGTNGQWQTATEIVRQSNGTYLTNQLGWTYDNLGRLTLENASANVAGLSYTNAYVYDLVGNRLWKTNISGGVTEVISCTYNTNDQLLVESSNLSGSFTNKYDVNGALTNRTSSVETNSYAFNFQNRLASAAVNRLESGVQLAETINYTYDYKGNRVRANWSRSVGGGSSTNGTSLFLIDTKSPLNQVLEELPTIGGTPTVTYTLAGRAVSQKRGSSISHLLPDGHGSTRQLADGSGSVTARYTFDAYGKGVDFTNSVQNPTTTPLLYSGERLDADAQMYHLQARYYNQAVGRFSQLDPFSPKQMSGAHLYAYGANDPVNNSDPTGLYEIDVHQFLTQYLGEKAGLGKRAAIEIGFETQGLDAPDDPRDAMAGGVNGPNMEKYHFVSEERLGELIGDAFFSGAGSTRQIGEYLHALEDTYSHSTGVGDRNWDYIGAIDVAGYTVIGSHKLIGHGHHGHQPDHTWRDAEKGKQMAKSAYLQLVNYATIYSRPASPPAVADWTSMEKEIRDFMIYEPKVYKEVKFNAVFVENVTFSGYNTKIKKLNSSYNLDAALYGAVYHDVEGFTASKTVIGSLSVAWRPIFHSIFGSSIPYGFSY